MDKYLTFDPIQLPSFGQECLKDGFSVRYLKYKRFFLFDGIYIPNGPITRNREELDKFFAYLSSLKLTKVKLDLPLILAPDLLEYIHSNLAGLGFRRGEYLQDNETILINKNNEKIDNKDVRYYCRKAASKYDFKVVFSPSHEVIDEVYELYKVSAAFQNYIPKPKEAFVEMAPSSYLGLAYNKTNGSIDGFVWGYLYKLAKDLACTDFYSIIDTVFIATNETARESYAGYGMHKALFEYVFADLNVDFINFEGASRNQNRKYLSFKTSFGGDFVSLGGSFVRNMF